MSWAEDLRKSAVSKAPRTPSNEEKLGVQLRTTRIIHGLSAEEFAQRVNQDLVTVLDLEKGKTQLPPAELLKTWTQDCGYSESTANVLFRIAEHPLPYPEAEMVSGPIDSLYSSYIPKVNIFEGIDPPSFDMGFKSKLRAIRSMLVNIIMPPKD